MAVTTSTPSMSMISPSEQDSRFHWKVPLREITRSAVSMVVSITNVLLCCTQASTFMLDLLLTAYTTTLLGGLWAGTRLPEPTSKDLQLKVSVLTVKPRVQVSG